MGGNRGREERGGGKRLADGAFDARGIDAPVHAYLFLCNVCKMPAHLSILAKNPTCS